MPLDSWLPVGFRLPDGAISGAVLVEGAGWQIVETRGLGRALLAQDPLAGQWVESGLLDDGALAPLCFGARHFRTLSSGPSHVLCPVSEGRSPVSKSDALAFAVSFKATREIDKTSPLQDAIYVEKLSRLLPTYSISSQVDDDVILGYWLTGGATVSVKSFRRLRQMLSWLGPEDLKEVVEVAGFDVEDIELVPLGRDRASHVTRSRGPAAESSKLERANGNVGRLFELPGRPQLASFVNEHIIDVVRNRDRYGALGIGFPSAVVLHGPTGCGKTFAVERLIDFLGWPSFQIDASTIASPYIHETSRRVAEVFAEAARNAPSVLVIDEMEAFLADREIGSGHHRVEEVAEFLRRIPEATRNEVLILATTNRVDMIDPAILRRGRFDHVVKVDYPSEAEVLSLLEKLLSSLPTENDVDAVPIAQSLAGRPLSDVAFVVREGARLAARSGRDRLGQNSLLDALSATAGREREGGARRRVGLV